jgi:chemotaxis protein MotB
VSEGRGGGGQERWLLTYADLITLLLAYFIVMFSMSQTDLEKFQMLAASVRRAFNAVDVSVLEGGSSQAGLFDDFPARNREYVRISSELTRLAREQGLEGLLSVNTRREGIVISISTSVLFDAGQAQIRPESEATLDAIAGLLRDMPNEVRVAGHTDNISPFPQWPSNWELSAARAIQVVRYLSTQGELDPRRLSAIGYAEYQPLYPNDTPEHRRLNRRVDILIIYEAAGSSVTGPAGFAPIEGWPFGGTQGRPSDQTGRQP